MRIGLVDVDGHNYPNLPLMKPSAWHKAQGDTVEWWWGFGQYDRVYMSKVFDSTYSPDIWEPLNAREIIKGGTGYGLWASEIEEFPIAVTKYHFGVRSKSASNRLYAAMFEDYGTGWLAYRRKPEED